jgi:hypothetical protein
MMNAELDEGVGAAPQRRQQEQQRQLDDDRWISRMCFFHGAPLSISVETKHYIAKAFPYFVMRRIVE